MDFPEKINKKEVELIQRLSEKAGFGVVPDSRFHNAKPSLEGCLVLFREGHGQYFEPSKSFNETGMILRLGAMVATIDTVVDERETELLHNLVEHDIKLSPIEKRSLHAYLTWNLNSPSNMAGLKTKLEKISSKEKASISHILVGVALADGIVDPREIKQLEKLYTALGLDKSMVSSDIHKSKSASIKRINFTADEEPKPREVGFKPTHTNRSWSVSKPTTWSETGLFLDRFSRSDMGWS